jgi:hypothetical protein
MQQATVGIYTFHDALMIGAPNQQRSSQRIYNSPDLAPVVQACSETRELQRGPRRSPRARHSGAIDLPATGSLSEMGSLAASYRAFKIRLRE